MLIRPCKQEDMEAVRQLILELENCPEEEMPRERFEQVYIANLADKDITYLLAEDAGRTVGFGSVHVQNLLHHCGPIAEVQELVVTAAYHGKGVGRMVLEVLENEAKLRGCPQVEISCNRKRPASHEFYEHMGYVKSSFKFTKKVTPYAD